MNARPALLLALAALALSLGCSPTRECNQATCLGCCDVEGTCQQGTSPLACGVQGGACQSCGAEALCSTGVCVRLPTGPGGPDASVGLDAGSDAGRPPDGGVSDAGAPPADAGSCLPGWRSCGGACVDPQSDPAHCGGCNAPCKPAESCVSGACAAIPTDCRQSPCPSTHYCDLADGKCRPGCASDPQCPQPGTCNLATHQCECAANLHRCGTACVANVSTATCGARCTPCPGISNGTATCDGQQCGLQCNLGHRLCQGVCAACPTGGASAFACSGTQCVASACAAGFHLCGGECKADADPSFCGTACVKCPAPTDPILGASCSAGKCAIGCSGGKTFCKGGCRTGACSWSAHTLYSGSDAEGGLDVSVDRVDNVHAAYGVLRTYSSGSSYGYALELRYATAAGDGAVSSPATVSLGCDTLPDFIELGTVDGGVSPMCAHPSGSTSELLHFVRSGGSWTSQVITSVSNSGYIMYGELRGADLGVDQAVYAHSAPSSTGADTIGFASWDAGTWTTETVAQPAEAPTYLWLLPGPQLRMAWQPAGPNSHSSRQLVVATRAGAGSWTSSPLPLSVAEWATVVRADPATGKLGVAYCEGGQVRYAAEASGWSLETVASGLSGWCAVDLAYGAGSTPHVAWSADGGTALGSKLGGLWLHEPVSPQVHEVVRIAVRPDGRVVLLGRTAKTLTELVR